MNIDFSKYEQAVGPGHATQLSLKLFIEDKDNKDNQIDTCEYALMLYDWLGSSDITMDELFDATSYKNAQFILDTMEKYGDVLTLTYPHEIEHYVDAIESLRFQKRMKQNETE